MYHIHIYIHIHFLLCLLYIELFDIVYTGTTSQQGAAEWGDDAVATEDELRERTSQRKSTSDTEPNAQVVIEGIVVI